VKENGDTDAQLGNARDDQVHACDGEENFSEATLIHAPPPSGAV
jgi:hypothetical protein